jgi:hypothetical protein
LQHIRGPVAESDAQAHGQQDRKDENPENCFRLTQEKTKTNYGQLKQAAQAKLTHHAGSFP